jgi:mRNA interferase MazF
VTYKSFEVVAVPLPFTDRKVEKRRPALILSDEIRFNRSSDQSVLAMITGQKNADWPLDTKITENRSAGLSAPSKVRMKLFTLDNRLIVKKIGMLTDFDKQSVIKALKSLLGLNWVDPSSA